MGLISKFKQVIKNKLGHKQEMEPGIVYESKAADWKPVPEGITPVADLRELDATNIKAETIDGDKLMLPMVIGLINESDGEINQEDAPIHISDKTTGFAEGIIKISAKGGYMLGYSITHTRPLHNGNNRWRAIRRAEREINRA